MSGVLKDFSVSVLVEAIEANQFEFSADLGRSSRAELHEDLDIVWFVTGIPFPTFNRVLRAQFETSDIDARIETALAPFKSRNVPMMWHTGPTTRPADLGEHLTAHGLMRTENEPGMAVDLLALDDDLAIPSALAIERIGDIEGLRKWCDIFAFTFELPDGVAEAIFDVELDLGVGKHPWRRLYVGLLRGEPVATSLLFLGAGVAGIYGVGTVPDARRRGIGKAMTVVPLLEARAMGYRIGVLHSSPMGLGVYRRLGFQEYCRLCYHVWPGG